MLAEIEMEDAREVVQGIADEYAACEQPDYLERSARAASRPGML